MNVPCLLGAWAAHQGELRGYLRHRLSRHEDADDLLQEVFVKALRQGSAFCAIDNPRAWLFHVARNTLADRLRVAHTLIELPADIAAPVDESPPVIDDLTQCLPRVLAELGAEDRLAITLCDIEGQPQQALAERLGITLSGAKSRLQRARKRLRAKMEIGCRVRYDERGQIIDFTPRPPLPAAD
jgi:RNA polymerase sigma-70 factor (ECF subfamily)